MTQFSFHWPKSLAKAALPNVMHGGVWYVRISQVSWPCLAPQPRHILHQDLSPICTMTWPIYLNPTTTVVTPAEDLATSAPGLAHICAGTRPHLRRDLPQVRGPDLE